MRNEIQALRSLSQNNRSNYQNRQLQQAKKTERSLENTVKILAYDVTTGRYQVQSATGQIFSARTISNGFLAKGASVSLVSPVGGIPIIDAMPR